MMGKDQIQIKSRVLVVLLGTAAIIVISLIWPGCGSVCQHQVDAYDTFITEQERIRRDIIRIEQRLVAVPLCSIPQSDCVRVDKLRWGNTGVLKLLPKDAPGYDSPGLFWCKGKCRVQNTDLDNAIDEAARETDKKLGL